MIDLANNTGDKLTNCGGLGIMTGDKYTNLIFIILTYLPFRA